MPNVLEYKIVGDISDLDKSLKQAEKLQAEYTASIEKTSKELADNIVISRNYKAALEQLNDEFKKGAISQKEYEKGLQNLKRDEQETKIATTNLRKELANLKREQKDLGGAFDKTTPKIANGGNTLLQFGRIAQDFPFGIQGIGNNITATAESFGYLSKSAGGAGNALKAVASSMLGSGGILLAVSLVTTGLTYMAQNGIDVSDVFKKISGNFNEARASMQELNAEAVKGSAEQVASMKAYVSVASNVNLSMEDRLIAVKKLQDEYPAYFGNLTKEQILNGNVAGAVKQVTAALIAKAKAAALTDKIVKLAEEEEKVQSEINNSIAAQFKLYKLSKEEAFNAAVILNKQLRGEIDLVKELESGNANNLTKTEKVALAAFQYSATLRGLSGSLQTNISEQDKLTKGLEATTAAQIKLDKTTEKGAKTPKAKKTKSPGVTPQLTSLINQLKAEDLVDVRSIEVATGLVDEFGLKISTFTDQLVDLQSIKVVTGELDEFGNKIERFSTDLKLPQIKIRPIESTEFLDSLEQAQEKAKIFSEAVGGSISVLAGQMAASLETGNAVLDVFVGSLINSLAQIAQAQLTSLITEKFINTAKIQTNQAVSTANAVTAASSTAAAAGPAAAFVLPGLVGGAIALMASTFAGIQAMAFAHGGIVPGGSFTGDKIPAMLNSGEAVLNSQQQANTLMAIANGNSNALQGNVRIDTFTLETALRGSDLLLAIKREGKKR